MAVAFLAPFHQLFQDSMTFLNPLMLLGLAAAAIPVLIHLLNLRKLRTVEFSSLQFLKELQRSSIRRLKIRQILLLLLRTALIASLVLAFSRPALRGTFAGMVGSEAGACVVLILDDSPSMAARNDHGVLFTQAQSAARDILAMARPNDELYVLLLSTTATQGAARTPLTLDAARALVQGATVSPVSVTIDTAVVHAVDILAATPQANRELFVISDGQATQFNARAGARDSAAPGRKGTYAAYLLMVPPEQVENTGIGPAEILTRIVTAGTPSRVRATVRNTGEQPLNDVSVSAYLDGTRMAQQSVDIGARSAATTELSVTPRRRGTLSGYVELEEDFLDADNRYYFALEIPERIRVLFAGTAEATRHARLALTLGGDSTLAGVFAVQQIAPERLDAMDLRTTDLVALCAIPSIPAGIVDRLARFVADGGALALFPGPGIDPQNYNTVVFPALGMPPAALTDLGAADQDAGTLRYNRIDYAHPLFEGLFDTPLDAREGRREIESPSILKAFAAPATGVGRTIITLSNGQTFLAEYKHGAGVVMAFAVDPGLQWSDFAVKGIFVPLLHRTMLYASPTVQRASGVTVGEPVEITLRQARSKAGDVFVLRTPEGREERLVPRTLPGGGLRCTGQPTREVGNHLLVRTSETAGATEETLLTIPVNLAARESDLRTMTDDDIAGFWNRSGLEAARPVTLRSSSDITASIREARVGVELWRHCLVLALLCALLEMAIGRAPRPEGSEL
jgi:hypothetical protein